MEFTLQDVIESMSGGEFNNHRKAKVRYVQHEKALGLKWGKRAVKGYEDSPARCQREVRSLQKIAGAEFYKTTHVWI